MVKEKLFFLVFNNIFPEDTKIPGTSKYNRISCYQCYHYSSLILLQQDKEKEINTTRAFLKHYLLINTNTTSYFIY